MVGWSETFEVLPAILVVGLSFATTQFLWSNFVDSNLVDIAAGAVSLVATILFLRIWSRKVFGDSNMTVLFHPGARRCARSLAAQWK